MHIYVAKTKALISFTVTAKLICVFVFAYAKFGFLITRLIYQFVILFISHLGFDGRTLVLILPVLRYCLPSTLKCRTSSTSLLKCPLVRNYPILFSPQGESHSLVTVKNGFVKKNHDKIGCDLVSRVPQYF